MRRWSENRDAEYPRILTQALGYAVGVHLLVVLFGALALHSFFDDISPTIDSGFKGTENSSREIHLIDPNSIQAHFFQRERKGNASMPDFRIAVPIEESPGPQPQPAPVERKPQPEASREFEIFDDDIELIEPVFPTHRDVSFSDHFYLVYFVEPRYPVYEQARTIVGNILVQFFVNSEGHVEKAEVLQSQALPPGSSTRAFELESLKAIRQWRFSAKTDTGRAQGERMLYVVTFADQ